MVQKRNYLGHNVHIQLEGLFLNEILVVVLIAFDHDTKCCYLTAVCSVSNRAKRERERGCGGGGGGGEEEEVLMFVLVQ